MTALEGAGVLVEIRSVGVRELGGWIDRRMRAVQLEPTRDAVDVPYQHGSKNYILIDTAGIRHRSKVSHSVEVFSVMPSPVCATR